MNEDNGLCTLCPILNLESYANNNLYRKETQKIIAQGKVNPCML